MAEHAYGGGLIADGPTGCVGRCTCGWRSEHSDDNAPALEALVEHLTKGEHLAAIDGNGTDTED